MYNLTNWPENLNNSAESQFWVCSKLNCGKCFGDNLSWMQFGWGTTSKGCNSGEWQLEVCLSLGHTSLISRKCNLGWKSLNLYPAYQQCVCLTREIAHKPYEPRYNILAVLNRMAPPPKYNIIISLYHYDANSSHTACGAIACHFCARARSHEVSPMGFAQPGYYLNWFDRYLGTLFPSIEIQLWGLAVFIFLSRKYCGSDWVQTNLNCKNFLSFLSTVSVDKKIPCSTPGSQIFHCELNVPLQYFPGLTNFLGLSRPSGSGYFRSRVTPLDELILIVQFFCWGLRDLEL
jgi:hypothetical protein